MRRLLIVPLIVALCSLGFVSSAGADTAAQCAPYGYESHTWTGGFNVYDGLHHTVAQASGRIDWNDDCYGIDPTLELTGHSQPNSALYWCGFDYYHETYHNVYGFPYYQYRIDAQARWRTAVSPCGVSTNAIVTYDIVVNANDTLQWDFFWQQVGGNPNGQMHGGGPI